MARLAISQKTITDITDGYTVNLTPNAGTFSTDNNKICEADTSFIININAFQGSESISSDVELDLSSITVNKIINGVTSTASTNYYSVTATSGTGGVKKFPMTITVHGTGTSASGKEACVADALLFSIPVYVEGTPTNNSGTNSVTDDDVVMNIVFVATGSQTGANGTNGTNGTSSYTWIRYSEDNDTTAQGAPMYENPTADRIYIGIANTSTNSAPSAKSSYTWSKYIGEDGTDGDDGKPGYTFIVKSSNGDVFRNNSGSTDITLYIYKADMQHMTGNEFEIETGGILRCFKDSVPSSGTTGEVTINKTEDDYFITVSASSINNVASYFWILEEN